MGGGGAGIGERNLFFDILHLQRHAVDLTADRNVAAAVVAQTPENWKRRQCTHVTQDIDDEGFRGDRPGRVSGGGGIVTSFAACSKATLPSRQGDTNLLSVLCVPAYPRA